MTNKKALHLQILLLSSALIFAGCSPSTTSQSSSFEGSSLSAPAESVSSSGSSSGSSLTSASSSANNGIPFSDIGKYVVQIVDAKALGIKHGKKKSSSLFRSASGSEEEPTKNVLVKTTNSYSSDDATANSDGTINVSFTKTITTETQTAITTTKTIIPGAPKYEAVILSADANGITVVNNTSYQFEVVDDAGAMVVPWEGNLSEGATSILLAFTSETGKKYSVLTRSINCSYSFTSLGNDSYTLTSEDEQTIYYQGVSDNADKDSDSIVGVIMFTGLTEGISYHLKETGTTSEVSITQDKIAGQIDKLLVVGAYTFMSFVPLDATSRPLDTDLTYDPDGISTYDKTNYYSDDTRQSFVIDNRTGLVYKIENFHIRTLKNGCILRDGDSLVYDMRINASKQLEFYSIFSNSTVTVKDCFKDKYGTRYVMNDKLNQYDAESNTYFFNLWEYTGSNANAGLVGYFLTSDNRAVKVTYDNTLSTTVVDAALMGEDKVSHRLADSDIFDIYYPAGITTTSEAYRVSHTVVFGFHTSQKNVFGSQNFYAVNTKNSVTGIFAYSSVNAKLFIDHDIVLELVTNSDGTKSLYEEKGVEKALSNFVLDSTSPSGSTFLPSANLTKRLLLDGVTLDSSGKLIHYGLSGNTYYDFGVEKKGDGSYQAIVYDEGTKSEEQVIVTMQPITR